MSDRTRRFGAVLFHPPAHEPFGCRERFGDIERLPDRAAQDRVHEGCGGRLPRPSHQFHGIVDRRMVGNAVQKADLVQSHLDRRPDGGVQTARQSASNIERSTRQAGLCGEACRTRYRMPGRHRAHRDARIWKPALQPTTQRDRRPAAPQTRLVWRGRVWSLYDLSGHKRDVKSALPEALKAPHRRGMIRFGNPETQRGNPPVQNADPS